MKEYIIISFAFEGFVRISYGDRAEVERIVKETADDYEGDLDGKFVDNQMIIKGFNSEYKREDIQYLIIKGEVITPQPVSKVTEWKI